ncbi:DNA cytosine methyltransferase [Methylocystis hirsuta]|uniref:DNA cytosine methyltransferase n=1 Tax=Methylocystis hirsuta TaxID=369798 RepID=A0A3M9XN29_9HYPH|nr:DNA cytosine methyltransferase [Methylocystis hirsuta]RNJ49411.1 DNA cytosine methyltransferase [Methylocystis hirsuta]
MTAYYLEHDPFAAATLRKAIAAGVVAPGEVDERDIQEVPGDDLKEFKQVHLFAGSGGWSIAARVAGIPDDFPVWTGSCPCQPFSAAGLRGGTADERHLWPHMARLILARRPGLVFGEQVSAKAGRAWFDEVAADLEGNDYACGAVDLSALATGGSQVRQRLWFVARANGEPPMRIAEPRRQLFSWGAEPAMGCVAHGIPNRMDILRVLGNALDVRLAAEVMRAFFDLEML